MVKNINQSQKVKQSVVINVHSKKTKRKRARKVRSSLKPTNSNGQPSYQYIPPTVIQLPSPHPVDTKHLDDKVNKILYYNEQQSWINRTIPEQRVGVKPATIVEGSTPLMQQPQDNFMQSPNLALMRRAREEILERASGAEPYTVSGVSNSITGASALRTHSQRPIESPFQQFHTAKEYEDDVSINSMVSVDKNLNDELFGEIKTPKEEKPKRTRAPNRSREVIDEEKRQKEEKRRISERLKAIQNNQKSKKG